MIVFVLLACVIWGIGWLMKTPQQARWLAILLLYVAFVAALVVLPPGTPIHDMLGGSAAQWLAVGAVGVLIYVYAMGLRRLRRHIRPENRPKVPPRQQAQFSETELERYARHIVLRELGGPGQQKLKAARVAVIGAGGLGAPVLQYLAASGVGTLTVVDGDKVEHTNLQRQVIHSEETLGWSKTASAARAMQALNPYVTVHGHPTKLTAQNAEAILAGHDLVLDGTDNFDTRYLVNETCVRLEIPLISAAISQWEGQISLFDPARGAPCYACVFPERPAPGMAPPCAEAGVVSPLPGVVGSMMALEAVKYLTGSGKTLAGRLMIYDGLFAQSRIITLQKRDDCAVCAPSPVPAPHPSPTTADA
ncbi:MAG: molybdopterin-synthase adenylyltransferase MoeB [Pseudomonadota bacterium]